MKTENVFLFSIGYCNFDLILIEGVKPLNLESKS